VRRVGWVAFALALGVATAAATAQDAPEVVATNTAPRFVDASPPRALASERLVEIQRRIQAALRYPPAARSREIVVHDSSGLLSLDRAAREAVTAAAPLPWVYGRLEVPVVFALDRRR
jgi:outer membrane biosynthesis protein TonB